MAELTSLSQEDESTRPRLQALRALLVLTVSYALAVLLLGASDALGLVGRLGDGHGLKTLDLLLLPSFGVRLTLAVHTTLLLGGAAYASIVHAVRLRSASFRALLLCLPLGVLGGMTSHYALELPLFDRLPLRNHVVRVLTVLTPVLIVALGVAIERVARNRTPQFRLLLVLPLALILGAFVRIFCIPEAVTTRIPATLFALVAGTYVLAFSLAAAMRVWPLVVGVLTYSMIGALLVMTSPPSQRARVNAIIAHNTEVLQALLFTQLFLFESAPSLPVCPALPPRTEPAPVLQAPRSVLVLTLDALRADRLAAYGYDRVTMPNVELLLRESLLFETAYAASPATAGSMTALWTGTGVPTLRACGRWPKTLQERLRAQGYLVVGSDCSPALRGIAPGFPTSTPWDIPLPMGTHAQSLVDALIASIDATPGPFMAFAHFMETHDAEQYRALPHVFPERAFSRYDDALFNVDAQLGRLFSALRASGRFEQTVIVFSADHGEFFGEHGRLHHGSLVYEPVMRVPFAIRAPGLLAGRTSMLASGFDLAPTVYRLATGKSWPVFAMGHDLIAELGDRVSSERRTERTVFMENVSSQSGVRRIVAVRKGRFKYTALLPSSIEELYDLTQDPGELHNLAGEDAATTTTMRAELNHALEERACELSALTVQP